MNAKGDLIARLVALGQGTPTFESQAHGPDHERTFQTRIWSGGQVLAQGEGRSKKDAERTASELALSLLSGQAPASAPTAPVTSTARTAQTAQTWPIYAPVLAGAIEAAIEFAAETDSLDDVRREAGRFYRELLADLGHRADSE